MEVIDEYKINHSFLILSTFYIDYSLIFSRYLVILDIWCEKFSWFNFTIIQLWLFRLILNVLNIKSAWGISQNKVFSYQSKNYWLFYPLNFLHTLQITSEAFGIPKIERSLDLCNFTAILGAFNYLTALSFNKLKTNLSKTWHSMLFQNSCFPSTKSSINKVAFRGTSNTTYLDKI